MKIIIIISIISCLISCAARVPPARPVLNTADGAACLRQCESIYTQCLGASGNIRTPIASTTAGILIGAIADSNGASNTQASCTDMLKPCYADCQRFNQ